MSVASRSIWTLAACWSLLIGNAALGQDPESLLPGYGIESPATASSGADQDARPALPEPLRPMTSLGVEVDVNGGLLPRDFAAEQLSEQAEEHSPLAAATRCWPVFEKRRVAPGSRSYPLYFEEVNAERYGYTCSRALQPAISAVHFFGTIPYLPYLMAADCPRECVYTLGHYRPGNCNPWRAHSFPYSPKAAGMEGAAIAGLIFLLP